MYWQFNLVQLSAVLWLSLVLSLVFCWFLLHSLFCWWEPFFSVAGTWHLAYHPRVYFPTVLQMSHNRTTKILVWIIRGINKQEKWHAIQVKITESAYQIFVCRKRREVLLIIFIWRNFCPRQLDYIVFSPSVGVFGGLITIRNSNMFASTVIRVNAYAITLKLQNNADGRAFHLSNICGPASSPEKLAFITWLIN
jgi:hypothetical protein